MSETALDVTRYVTCECDHVSDRHCSPGNLQTRWAVHPLLGECNVCSCSRFVPLEKTRHAAVCLRPNGVGLRYLVPYERKDRLFFFLARITGLGRFWLWVFYR